MLNIIRCVIGFLAFIFGFYMFLDDSRRGISDKLTKEEKRYFDIIDTWFYISIMMFSCYLLEPLSQYFN